MESSVPKPGPYIPKVNVVEKAVEINMERCRCGKLFTEVSVGCEWNKHKQPFVRKPHLTDKPFKENQGLQQLRQTMQKPIPKRTQNKRTNRRSK